MRFQCIFALALTTALLGAERLPLADIQHGALLNDLKKEIASGTRSTLIISTIPEYWLFNRAAKGEVGSDDYQYAESLYRDKLVIFIIDLSANEDGVMVIQPKVKADAPVRATVQKDGKSYQLPVLNSDAIETTTRPYANAIAKKFNQDGSKVQIIALNNTDNGSVLFSGYEKCSLSVEYDGLKFEYRAPFSSLFTPRYTSDGNPAPADWKFDPWTGKPLDP